MGSVLDAELVRANIGCLLKQFVEDAAELLSLPLIHLVVLQELLGKKEHDFKEPADGCREACPDEVFKELSRLFVQELHLIFSGFFCHSDLFLFLFMQLVFGLVREVVRDVEAEVSVDEVADEGLEGRHGLAIAVEGHLLGRLRRDVVTRCDPLVDRSHHCVRWDLHREQHLDQLLTRLVLIQTLLGDVPADFPDFEEAEDDLMRVRLRHRLKE